MKSYTTFEFESMKRETSDAWLLVMQDGSELWFPKNKCFVLGGRIRVPDKLCDEIMNEDLVKLGFN